ncbi:glycosyl hydrolase family 28-related protein [Sunxiuqinia sp. A32]|uniref:glycosyl hydrolase family 28-related protein n=1 Tax=Sunxiuqinia sp. A32 TaxID=3461496 RepID=UPI004046144D
MIKHITLIILLLSVLSVVCGADLTEFGIVDVTKSPFFADSTGASDCTEALQKAIDYAQQNHMVAFFPTGVYKISNTLECRHAPPELEKRGDFKSGRYWGITLFGSTESSVRPKILLANNSSGYADEKHPKLVLNFHMGRPQTNPPKYPNFGPSFMNSRLIGIDVEIGKGNLGAVAVRMRGAQGMAIEDATIDVTHGLIGIEGANGSGGSNVNVTVVGGKIGFDGSASQPNPCLTGFTFIDQTQHAILYQGRQTLTATGVKIVSKYPITAVKAVDLWTKSETSIDILNGLNNKGLSAWNGPINFVDCQIEFSGGAGTAFDSNCGVYLNNCYVKNAEVLINHTSGGIIDGLREGWIQVKEYAQGYDMRPFNQLKYTSPIYVDGEKQDEAILEMVKGVVPPVDLISRHAWDSTFPSWDREGAVNVKNPPYNAKGDGVTDDTQAIQRAINENEIVFVPSGLYRVTKTIDLKSNSKLIGLMPNITGLIVTEAEGDFLDDKNPQPILRTPDDADAEVVVAFIGTWARSSATSYDLLWRAGRKSIVRDWMIMHDNMKQPERIYPSVRVTGNGGGRWYNYYDETWSFDSRSSFRHLLVDGTTEPFRIYQCNPEHARSDANMEIRNSRNITLYGVKCEANAPAVLIRNSENIRVFGFGGNETPWPNTSAFQIENSKNILLASLFNQPRLHKGGPDQFNGPNVEPDLWHMVIESTSGGRMIIAPPLERPVIYKSGSTQDVW